MAFGPEYIYGLQAALNARLPWRVSKVEGGESWVAMQADKNLWLLLSWGADSGCCLADTASVDALKKGSVARTPLVEALKSRFLKGQILSARQLNRDRILELEAVRFVAAGFGMTYFLVLEATSPSGNLLLLDGDRKIEELARHVPPDQNRFRTLLPGHLYVPPPLFDGRLPSEIETLTLDELAMVKGIGRPLARVIEERWEERSPDQWLESLRALYEKDSLTCRVLVKNIKNIKNAKNSKNAPRYFTRFPFPLRGTEAVGEDALDAAGEGVLRPLLSGSRSRILRELDARVERAVKSKERRLDGLLNQLKNSADAELFKRRGELLLANLTAVPARAESVTLTGWDGETLEITLNPNLTPARNAERYFKKYKKAHADPQKIQEAVTSLKNAIAELREQRDLLDSIEDPAKLEEAARDVMDWLAPEMGEKAGEKPGKNPVKARKAKEKTVPPHLRFEFGGRVILVGLSARGNRYVTFKQAAGDDLWLHAHEVPGAHVIIRGANGREEDEETILFAASLAAAYSRDKESLAVQVDYTERRYVRSVPGAAIALVTYAQPGTVRVAPGRWKELIHDGQ